MPHPTSMNLRAYRPDDRDALVELWHRCGLVVPANDPAGDIALKTKHDPDGLIIGEAKIDGSTRLIASVMVGYEGHRGWVNYLAVDPVCRRQGLGSQLMQHAESWLRERGCPKLNLQVRTRNAKVLAFYQAVGFRQDDVVSMGKRFSEA